MTGPAVNGVEQRLDLLLDLQRAIIEELTTIRKALEKPSPSLQPEVVPLKEPSRPVLPTFPKRR